MESNDVSKAKEMVFDSRKQEIPLASSFCSGRSQNIQISLYNHFLWPKMRWIQNQESPAANFHPWAENSICPSWLGFTTLQLRTSLLRPKKKNQSVHPDSVLSHCSWEHPYSDQFFFKSVSPSWLGFTTLRLRTSFHSLHSLEQYRASGQGSTGEVSPLHETVN